MDEDDVNHQKERRAAQSSKSRVDFARQGESNGLFSRDDHQETICSCSSPFGNSHHDHLSSSSSFSFVGRFGESAYPSVRVRYPLYSHIGGFQETQLLVNSDNSNNKLQQQQQATKYYSTKTTIMFGGRRNNNNNNNNNDRESLSSVLTPENPPKKTSGSSVTGFDPEGLERAAKAARDLDSSRNASAAIELIKTQEVTKQVRCKI